MAIEMNETVIAGGPEDYLEARHVSLRGTNREIGYAIASIARDVFDASPLYSPDPTVAAAIHAYFREHYPIHGERLLGAADAYGIPEGDPLANFVGLPFLIPLSGCSAASVAPGRTENGHAMLSKHMDFSRAFGGRTATGGADVSSKDLPTASRPYFFEIHPDEGYASMYTCQYDLLTGVHDGVNSEGLGVALLADDETIARYPNDQPLTVGVGMYAPMLLRFLLDTCANVAEAKAALLRTKQYPFMLPSHMIISDRHGDSFVWEKAPLNGAEHIIDRDGDIQTLTNHLVSEPAPTHVSVDTDVGWTRTRLARLTETVNAIDGPISPGDMKKAHESVRFTKRWVRELTGSDEIADGFDARTIWHSLYDLESRQVEVSFYLGDNPDGSDRRSEYLTFQLNA